MYRHLRVRQPSDRKSTRCGSQDTPLVAALQPTAFTHRQPPLTLILTVLNIRHSNLLLPDMRAYLLPVATLATNNRLPTVLVV
jgi:hypothetical protein